MEQPEIRMINFQRKEHLLDKKSLIEMHKNKQIKYASSVYKDYPSFLHPHKEETIVDATWGYCDICDEFISCENYNDSHLDRHLTSDSHKKN